MSLDTAIDGLRTTLSAMAGLKRTYADPPESINEFPALIVYVQRGEMHFSAAGGHSLHTLIAEVYHARQVLPEAADAAKVWPDLAYAILKADQTLGGAVSHIVGPLTYQMLPLQYNALIHFGVRFTVTVKVNES